MVDVCRAMKIALDVRKPFVLFVRGIYSQWHKSKFYGPMVVGEDTTTSHTWSSGEQYMMACKAALFNDKAALLKIQRNNNPREIKQLGRQVRGFNNKTWNQNKFNIVVEGNHRKFHNADLRAAVGRTSHLFHCFSSFPFSDVYYRCAMS